MMFPVGSAKGPHLEDGEHLDDLPMAHIRSADGQNGSLLRKDPSSMSDLLTNNHQRICNGDVLVLLDWRSTNGFFLVESDAKKVTGWIRASHIEFVRFGEVDYKLFDPIDELWWCSSWNFDTSKCWIRLQETIAERRNWSDLVQHLNEIGVSSKMITDELLGHWSDKGYTYVALELGKATSTLDDWESYGNVHVTLGYLPTMQPTERTKLYDILNQILQEWKELPAEFRPARLLHFRQFRIQTWEERGYDSWTRKPIVFHDWSYIQQLISEERLQSHAQTDEDIMKLSKRIWERDTDRLLDAQLRAKALPQLHAGVLTMHAPCKGLGAANDCTKSAEILDLLEYLVSSICCFKPAYTKLHGKLLVPMVSDPCQWHCSPPRDPWFARVSSDGTHSPMSSIEPTTTAPPPG